MIRVVGLQNHPSRCFAAASASGHLGQKLKSALSGAEIRKAERKIRTDDTHQGYAGKIMALGHHLSPHQDVHLPVLKALEYFYDGALAGCCVPVHAQDLLVRKQRFYG